MRIQIILEDDRGGGGIETFLAGAPVLLTKGQAALSLPARQSFVLKHHRKTHLRAEAACKLLHLRSQVVRRAIETPWQPHDHKLQPIIFIGKMGQRLRQSLHRGGAKAANVKRLERSRQDFRRIADRDSDSTLTNIKSHYPHRALYYLSSDMQQARVFTRRSASRHPASDGPTLRVALSRLTCVALCALSAGTRTLHGQQSSPPLATIAPGPPPATQDRAEALQAEAERLARESRTLLGELRKLEIERDLQNERARQATSAVADASRALAIANGRLVEIEAQRAAQIPDVSARLVDLYKRGRSGNVRLLLGATSLRDFARTTRAVASMTRVTETRLQAHRRLLASAQAERAVAAAAVSRLQAESRKVEQGQAAAVSAVRARATLLADIDKRRDLTAQLAGELQVAARKLDEQVVSVATAPPPATPSPTAPVFPPRLPVRGGLEWPLDGRISGRFGEPSLRTAGAAPRNGVEIEAIEGARAKAIHAGSVVFASPFPGFGTLVIVDHSHGYHSVYGYLASTTLSKGDVVDVGREVGRVAATPGGPPALYFEFRIDGRSVDPVQWLRPR